MHAKGLVYREMDTRSGIYPYPVYYELKGPISQFEKRWRDGIIEPLKRTNFIKGKSKADSISFFMEYLNLQTGLTLLNNPKNYFDTDKIETDFSKNLDFSVLAFYREGVSILKEKLQEAAVQGVNVPALIYEAEQKMLKHFEHLQKE
jgi:hypothetical protein